MSRGNFLSDEVVQPQTPPPRCRHREKQFSRPVGKPPSPSPRRSRAPSAHSAVCRLERNCCRSLIQVPGSSLLQPSAPCTFDLPQREASVSVMHLPDEGKLLRERVQQRIRVGVIEDLLPHVRHAKSQVVHGGYEVNWIAARRHRGGEQFLPARTQSTFWCS